MVLARPSASVLSSRVSFTKLEVDQIHMPNYHEFNHFLVSYAEYVQALSLLVLIAPLVHRAKLTTIRILG